MITIGWREWACLPELNIPRIKIKIDTGARTSALHAFHVEYDTQKNRVHFLIHPYQRKLHPVVECTAKLKEMRVVTDSGGHKEERPVIETLIQFDGKQWPIEITLTSRDDLCGRMLLGRTAMLHRILVDPSRSYLLGKKKIS
jgi:hypothetical protein